MTRWQKAFFTLIDSGLWEKVPNDLSCFPLSDEDWLRIYEESVRQTVQGLSYQGVLLLPEDCQPPHEITWKWMACVNRIEKRNQKVAEVTQLSLQILRDAGTEPILMKGQAIGSLYSHPEWRVSGDIDWFVPASDRWSHLITCLKEKGLLPTIASDGSLFFILKDVEIELHSRLIDVESPGHRRRAKKMIDEDETRLMSVAPDLQVRIPSPRLSLIMLTAHIMKHAFTVGVGLRQFCDFARASHVWFGTYDTEKLMQSLKELGLTKWSELLFTFLLTYLDVSSHELPCPLKVRTSDSERLLRMVMSGGNFGQQTTAWQSAADKDAITWHTIHQFIYHLPMSMRYAPWETLCRIATLTIGHRYR